MSESTARKTRAEPASDVERLTYIVRDLMQEISDLRAGIPFHTHRCTDHSWRCTSPYCDAIEHPCLEHGGGPIGPPPAYQLGAGKFVRGAHAHV